MLGFDLVEEKRVETLRPDAPHLVLEFPHAKRE